MNQIREILVSLLISSLVALIIFSPVWSDLSQGASFPFSVYEIFFHNSNPEPLLGTGIDVLGSFWMVHEVGQILTGEQGTILSDVYAPFGFDLGMHTGFAWLDAVLGVPLAWMIGVPGFYNLHLFLVIVISFSSLLFLLRKMGLSWLLSVALGQLVFMHSFVLGELISGRPTQVHLLFPVLFCLALFNMQQNDWRFRDGVLAGISLAGSCLVYWFGGVAIGVCGALIWFIFWLQKKERLRGWFVGIVVMLSSLSLTLAITWRAAQPLIVGRGKRIYSGMDVEPVKRIELGAFNLPIQNMTDISTWAQFQTAFLKTELPLPFLFVFVLSSILAWRINRNKQRPWFWASFFALGFPFGAALSIGKLWFPTGFVLLQTVFPPMIRCQYMERLQFAFLLCALVCIAWNWLAIRERFGHLRWLEWGSCAFLLLINLHNWPSSDKIYSSQFEVYDEVAAFLKEKEGAILEVPFSASNSSYVQQIWHQHPIGGGPGLDTIREGKHKRYFERNKFIAQLQQLSDGVAPQVPLQRKDLLQLQKDNFRWVLVHLNEQKGEVEDYQRWSHSKGQVLDDGKILLFPLTTKVLK